MWVQLLVEALDDHRHSAHGCPLTYGIARDTREARYRHVLSILSFFEILLLCSCPAFFR